MLKINKLNKNYGKDHILNNISYDFPSSGLFYILGPSGSGKSSFINILGMIDEDFDGQVELCGYNYKEINEESKRYIRQKLISFSFQEDELNLNEKVIDNIRLAQKISGTQIDYDSLVEELKIKEKLNSKIDKLSGGEKKRVGIIRCLAKKAKLYLLDEPLNGLDKLMRQKVINILKRKSQTSLVIVVTHQKDEIEDDANVISINDGTITTINRSEDYVKCSDCIEKKIGHKKFIYHVLDGLRKIFRHRSRAYANFFSLILTFISLGLSTLILTSVKDTLTNSITNNIFKDGLSIEEKSKTVIDDERKDANIEILEEIKKDFPSVKDTAYFYNGDYMSMFPNANQINLLYNENTIRTTLGLSDLINTVNVNEVINTSNIDKEVLKNDEIILGINDDLLEMLSNMIGIDPDLNMLNKRVSSGNLRANLLLKNQSWNYSADVIFTVKKVISASKPYFIHTNYTFVQNLIENELKLNVSEKKESSDKYPWTVKRESYVILSLEYKERFVEDFLKSNKYLDYSLLPNPLKDINEDEIYSLRFGIERNVERRINLDIENELSISENIISRYYSSNLYTFGNEGLYSGFFHPIYFSSNKSYLNKLVDDNYFSDESSSELQRISIDPIEGIVPGDIFAGIKQKGVVFDTNIKKIIQGREPKNSNEIVVSKGFAKAIELDFSVSDNCHFAYLSNTEYRSNGYINTFICDSLRVVGITNDERKVIYQDEFFIPKFGLEKLHTNDGCNIDKMLLRVDLQKNELKDLKKNLQKENKQYFFTLPGLEVYESINASTQIFTIALLVFTIVLFSISCFLLSFTLTLFILENKRNIAIDIAFGSSKKEVKLGYIILALIYGLISSFAASFTLLMIQFIFNNLLIDIIGLNLEFSVLPHLLIICVSIVLSLISALSSTKGINKLTPKDVLLKM